MRIYQKLILCYLVFHILFFAIIINDQDTMEINLLTEKNDSGIRTRTSSDEFLLTPYRTMPFYQGNISSSYDFYIVAVDLNHDGEDDMVLIQENLNYFIALNTSGEFYWVKKDLYPNNIILSGDFDRDGYLDDIVTYFPLVTPSTELSAWDESGVAITEAVNGVITYQQVIKNALIGDFNGDGYLDDISFHFGNVSGFYFGTMNFHTREFIWTFPLENDYVLVASTPCDLTNSGYLNNFFLTTSSRAYAIGSDGVSLWNFSGGGDRPGIWKPVTIGDLDHDGLQDDVVFISPLNNSIYALNNFGSYLWEFSSSTALSLEICDYDGDGFTDELYVVEKRYILLLNESGGLIWKTSNMGFDLWNLGIGDVTGDGFPDFLISGDELLLLNHTGTILWKSIYGFSSNFMMIADFTADGVATESLWYTMGGQAVAFRVGAPDITISFQEGSHMTTSVGVRESLHARITSWEPYLGQLIEVSYNGSYGGQQVYPPNCSVPIEAIPLSFAAAGEYTYEISLSYGDVVFTSATIHITANFDTYLLILGAVGGVVGALIVGERVIRHRRRAKVPEVVKKVSKKGIPKYQ